MGTDPAGARMYVHYYGVALTVAIDFEKWKALVSTEIDFAGLTYIVVRAYDHVTIGGYSSFDVELQSTGAPHG